LQNLTELTKYQSDLKFSSVTLTQPLGCARQVELQEGNSYSVKVEATLKQKLALSRNFLVLYQVVL